MGEMFFFFNIERPPRVDQFRRQGMRYQGRGDGPPGSVIAESRVAMLGDLLGITSWRPSASAVRLTPDGT